MPVTATVTALRLRLHSVTARAERRYESKETMNIRYQYAKGRVAEGVQELCTSPGDVRSRLLAASDAMSSLSSAHFPRPLQSKWDEIMNMMTKYGPAKDFEGKVWQGAVAHTMRRIKNSTGVKIASALWELHQILQSEY